LAFGALKRFSSEAPSEDDGLRQTVFEGWFLKDGFGKKVFNGRLRLTA
jgi:hypothetical protein